MFMYKHVHIEFVSFHSIFHMTQDANNIAEKSLVAIHKANEMNVFPETLLQLYKKSLTLKNDQNLEELKQTYIYLLSIAFCPFEESALLLFRQTTGKELPTVVRALFKDSP